MNDDQNWAENDYEPTLEEVEDIFRPLREEHAVAAHGEITFVASIERYIWQAEDIYWGHRRVGEDGRVTFSWMRSDHP